MTKRMILEQLVKKTMGISLLLWQKKTGFPGHM